MTSQETRQYLNSFVNYENTLQSLAPKFFQLERIQHLLGLIGNPQKKLKIIHVTGTKGKGSTCAFIASILRAAGYRVGLYTSPHLHDYKERIRILDALAVPHSGDDGFPGKIREDELGQMVEEIKPAIETVRGNQTWGNLSYFEVLTVLAIYYFYKGEVDYAVLETGLGGRLDATNVVDSLACGLTPISLEHTQQLGTTLKEIAQEKAAIIKGGTQRVIIAPQEEEVREVIAQRCREFDIKPLLIGRDIGFKVTKQDLSGQTFSIVGTKGPYDSLTMGLLGAHQVINASVAVGVVEALQDFGFNVGRSAIAQGMKETLWPGRFEIIQNDPLVILDGAHNPASCRALVQTIQNVVPHKKIVIILGTSNDKDKKGICQELRYIASRIIFTKADHPRAYDFTKEPFEDVLGHVDVSFTNHVNEALETALCKAQKEDVILVTGSLFVVGEARELLMKVRVS